MLPIHEKKYNAAINVWLRAPFLVCTATFCYLQLYLQASYIPRAFSKSHVVCTETFCYLQLYLQAIAILSSCRLLLSLR